MGTGRTCTLFANFLDTGLRHCIELKPEIRLFDLLRMARLKKLKNICLGVGAISGTAAVLAVVKYIHFLIGYL